MVLLKAPAVLSQDCLDIDAGKTASPLTEANTLKESSEPSRRK